MGRVWIGTSGFTYDDWKGKFYPEDVPKTQWFEHYASHFPAVELNVTFYRLPKPEAFRGWRKRSPAGYKFWVKGSRYITHIKRLKDPKPSLKKFFGVVSPLKEKLAGLLWQFPPNMKRDAERLAAFLDALAKHTKAPSVFEFRDASWLHPDVEKLLRKHGAVYCRADWPPFYLKKPVPDTAPLVYIRRHGVSGEKKYSRRYTDAQLKKDAADVKKWLKQGKDVYEFFNNDVGGQAIEDARRLARYCGVP